MVDWLRLPSGQAVNMDRVVRVAQEDEWTMKGDAHQLLLCTVDGDLIKLRGEDIAAVQRYLEDRTYGGERAPRQRQPAG